MSDNEKAPEQNQEQEVENTTASASGPSAKAGDEKRAPLPKVDFSTFVLSIASSALVHLGEVPSPETGKVEADLLVAKSNIDVLDMLRDKIANGLNDDESKLLEGILYELRMKYVIKSS